MAKLKNHVIICNWNHQTCEIVRSLHATVIREESERIEEVSRAEPSVDEENPWRPIVVLADNVHEFPDEHCFEDTMLIPGTPLNTTVLKRANVEDAQAVLIVPDLRETNPDDKTFRIALQIRAFLEENRYRDEPWVVANVVDSRNADPFRRTEITGINEVISPDELGLKLLAQANISPGVTFVLNDLLKYSDDTSELYPVSIPVSWEKLDRAIGSMRDLYDVIEDNSGAPHRPGALVIGFATKIEVEGGNCSTWQYFINPIARKLKSRGEPGQEKGKPLDRGDKLIVLARDLAMARTVVEERGS